MREESPPPQQNNAVRERVAAHPFLSGITSRHIDLLAKTASLAQFGTGDVIFRTGDEAHGFYLIESGSVSVEGAIAGKPHVQVELVGGGHPLGWSWLFPPYQWHYDARAAEATTALFSIAETCGRSATTISHLATNFFSGSAQ